MTITATLTQAQIVAMHHALSHPWRWRILDLLRRNVELTVTILHDALDTDETPITPPNLCHHLSILKAAGLVTATIRSDQRYRYYALNRASFDALIAALDAWRQG